MFITELSLHHIMMYVNVKRLANPIDQVLGCCENRCFSNSVIISLSQCQQIMERIRNYNLDDRFDLLKQLLQSILQPPDTDIYNSDAWMNYLWGVKEHKGTFKFPYLEQAPAVDLLEHLVHCDIVHSITLIFVFSTQINWWHLLIYIYLKWV